MVIWNNFCYKTYVGVQWTNFYYWPIVLNPLSTAQKLFKKFQEVVKFAIIMRYVGMYGFSYLNDIAGGQKTLEHSDKV